MIWFVMLILRALLVSHEAQPPTTTISIPAPTSQPASTQPAATTASVELTVKVPPPSDEHKSTTADTAVEAFQNTTLGQIFAGKRKLSINDVLDYNFWLGTVNQLVVTILAFIPRLIGTLVFLFVFYLIYRAIRRMAIGRMKKSDVDSSIRDMLATLIRWCVMGFGVVIACNQLGIPIVAMLTGVSIIGLAVGFAAQETLANFIAGIVIFLDKPFVIGDWVQIDGMFGQVKRVSFRSTRMLTLDGEVVVMPNTQVLSKPLSNHSTNPINRVSVSVGIAYKESIDDARRVLLKLVENDERLARTPAPEVVVSELSASSVNLLLRFWIIDEAQEKRVVYEYTEKAKNALDAARIEIPFPHMQVVVEKSEAIDALTKARAAA